MAQAPVGEPPAAGRRWFEAQEARLARRVTNAQGASVTFRRPLAPCSFEACGGQCCAWGTQLDQHGAADLREIVVTYRPFFETLGMDLDPDELTYDTGTRVGDNETHRTQIRPRSYDTTELRPPPGLPDTACVMLTSDGRCSLQALGMDQGVHPWTYKPPVCWAYPILTVTTDEPVSEEGDWYLSMPDAGDPLDRGAPHPCPPCAQPVAGARPAFEVLDQELTRLGTTSSRPALRDDLTNQARTFRGPLTERDGYDSSVTMPGTAAPPTHSSTVGRNDPCPCGSGTKFKRCHGR